MPRRRPRKVDRAGVSTASDVAVVVALFFGHLDGEGQAAGYPGVDGASAISSPRSRFGGWARGQRTVLGIGRVQGFFRAKAQRFGANDGDACGCRNPFAGAVVVTFAMLGLRVKTLTLRSRRRRRVRRYPREGVVVEPRSPWSRCGDFGGKPWLFLYFYYYFLSAL
jgi:hypothetical protein